MSESAYELGVVCEAWADQNTACGLADRALVEEIDWLEPEMLDAHRQWRGLTSEELFLKWADVRSEVARAGLKVFGRFRGEPGEPDAHMARRALLLFTTAPNAPEAVLLLRDSDGDADRRLGLEQARNDRDWPFTVIIGVAHPKRECWVLAGFTPRNPEEEARLRLSQERLSFHPTREAHWLTAREHGAKTDAKRALQELTLGDAVRERECLDETPLSELEEQGAKTGLPEFVMEVRTRLVPVLGGQRSR